MPNRKQERGHRANFWVLNDARELQHIGHFHTNDAAHRRAFVDRLFDAISNNLTVTITKRSLEDRPDGIKVP